VSYSSAQFKWQSGDGVLSAEICQKEFTLGDIPTGGSVYIRLLLHKPQKVLPEEQAALFSQWTVSEPIPFELIAQYDLMGRQTTRILNVCNTDGVFKEMGIESFLMNTLLQFLNQFMRADSLVVAGMSGKDNVSVDRFFETLFDTDLDEHHDYIALLGDINYCHDVMLRKYPQFVTLSEFTTSLFEESTENGRAPA
jgi:hypothetical protein